MEMQHLLVLWRTSLQGSWALRLRSFKFISISHRRKIIFRTYPFNLFILLVFSKLPVFYHTAVLTQPPGTFHPPALIKRSQSRINSISQTPPTWTQDMWQVSRAPSLTVLSFYLSALGKILCGTRPYFTSSITTSFDVEGTSCSVKGVMTTQPLQQIQKQPEEKKNTCISQ